MDELKRWREERAARRLDRRVRGASSPNPSTADDLPQLSLFGGAMPAGVSGPLAEDSAPRFLRTRRPVSSAPPVTSSNPPHERVLRRRELLARASHRTSRGASTVPINWMPEPDRISPVHPLWDIPRNKRLRTGLLASLIFHAVAIPLFLLGTKIDFGIFSRKDPDERTVAHMQLVPLPPVRGQGGTGLRKIQNDPPPKQQVKPPDNRKHPTPPAPKPQPKPTKPVTKKPAETADTKVTTVTPVPDKPTKATDRKTEDRVKPAPVPAISNDVVAGPLLAAKGPVPGSELAIGGANGVEFPYNYYLELLRSKIAGVWKVPAGSVPPGKRAVALVTFRIQRSGAVSKSSLEEPSGRRDFDEAALRAIVDAQPFAPLPASFGGQFLTVNFQFAYQGQ